VVLKKIRPRRDACAAYISGMTVFQVKLTSSYGMADFKANITNLYASAGLKNQNVVFLFTDQQVCPRRPPAPSSGLP
jgi:hypothetical protein